MTTVPQPYVYAISSIPGGVFGGEQSDRLVYLITTQIAAAGTPTVSSDSLNVIIEFAEDLTTEQKTTLDGLVPHCADIYIITTDGGVTDLGNPATVTKTAGVLSATTITLQIKSGDGTSINGFEEPVYLLAPIMTIDKIEGNFDGTGKFAFTIGAILDKGQAQIEITADNMPAKTLIARWI